jgi:hypothetical protein
MKYKLSLLLAIFMLNFGYSQLKYEWGAAFDYDVKDEKDPQIVLKDNYNHYLLTVVDVIAQHQMIIRKFDQKNQLVDTYKYDFPKLDASTLYNYLGFTEVKGKVIVFTQIYSNKAKKSEIYKLEFDKATGKFTSTPITSVAIASAYKSGTVKFSKSLNGSYIGIVHIMHRTKGEPEKNMVLTLDATTNVAWQKEASFTNDHTTVNTAVTNSGKIILLRLNLSFKKANNNNYVVIETADKEEEKTFETPIFLNDLTVLSIGTQDYLLAFNSKNRGDYNNLLFYDLQLGKTLQNTKISEFSSLKDLKDVIIKNVFMQNNEIHLFTEAKTEVVVPVANRQTSGGFGSSFPDPVFQFGPAQLFVLDMDGTLKTVKKLNVPTPKGLLYSSFGVVNIKGNYYINTGNFNGFYALNSPDFEKSKTGVVNFYQPDPLKSSDIKFVNQLETYFPDGNRMLFARVVNDQKMSFVSVSGIE